MRDVSNVVQQAAEKLGFVSGHNLSCAVSEVKMRASAPVAMIFRKFKVFVIDKV